MKTIYQTNLTTNAFSIKQRTTPGCWIDLLHPTEKELHDVSEQLSINESLLKAVLDNDEQPRIDVEDNVKMVLVDVPYIFKNHQNIYVKTRPLGILIVRDEYIVTISNTENEILNDFKDAKVKEFYTYKKSRFLIQILYRVASFYLKHLQTISQAIESSEDTMLQATKNKDLMHLLSLEKSLVYITTALKSNAVVLEKILKGNTIDFYEEDRDLLEDAIIENNQGIEMSNLYREILSSMTTSIATMISNNLNTLMKFLAGITIVLSIPTMVASFMGMNVPLGILTNHPWAFLYMIGVSILLSLLVALILKRKNML